VVALVTAASAAYAQTAAEAAKRKARSEIQNEASVPVFQIRGSGLDDACHSDCPRAKRSIAPNMFPPPCNTMLGKIELVK
jgi:hypothetical protein